MRFAARILLFAAALTITIACRSPKLTAGECSQMLDRYIEMSLHDDPSLTTLPPTQAAVARDAKKEQKKRDPSYRLKEHQCADEVRKNEFDCAMAAHNPNEWEACIQ
jgi:hypothetical protein